MTEKLLLERKFDASERELWSVINRLLAKEIFGASDLKHLTSWHGDYYGAEMELIFAWEGTKQIWLGVTEIGDSPWNKHEFYTGSIEVSSSSPTADSPVIVRISAEWPLLRPLFQRLADYMKGPRRGHEVFVDEIDSFAKASMVSQSEVEHEVPLALLEDEIKSHLQQIIGEPFSSTHWPGETNDLFTSRLVLGGTRIRAAFLLKGRGTRGKLRLKDCGINGDQIVRLASAPADIYIVQHVDAISENVVKDLRDKVELKRSHGAEVLSCFMDGFDTARVLKAYDRLV